MKEVIRKANVLIEALPYIQEFRGEIIVVKVGGSAMEEPAHMRGILKDVVFMECVGMRTVIVHGGGKAISRGLKGQGIGSKFVDGHRVTCAKSIKVVEQVFKEEVGPALVEIMQEMGGRARSLHGDRVFKVEKKKAKDDVTGKQMHWGFVGDPIDVVTRSVRTMLREGIIPVISPLGLGSSGKIYNINADVAASALAKALKARKLAFVSDVPGLLRDASDQSSVMATLKCSEVESLMKNGVISGGMLPKVESGVEALHAGVRKIHMIDGRMSHSLLLEIFTDKGVGTEIVRDS